MSKKLSLSLAVGPYEHVRDLVSGEVPVEGIELTPMHCPIEDLLYRTHNFSEWHIAELGLGGYVARLARGEQPYVAIPVFTSRMFRHSAIYVRADANIQRPEDLNGKTIGMPEWGMAAAVWARGMLSENYGFDPRSVHWKQGGLNQPGRVDRAPPSPELGMKYETVSDRSLDELLMSGEIDALFSARLPEAFNMPDSPVRRLFADTQSAELAYWKDTGIFPIMHLIGIRKDIYEEHPWVAQQLLRSFDASKNRSLARAKDTSSAYFPVPLMLHAVQTAIEIAGDDFWPYGVEPNRKTLEAFLRYSHEQGITARQLSVDEIFAKETSFTTRT